MVAVQCIQAPMCVHVLMERQEEIVSTVSFVCLSVCLSVAAVKCFQALMCVHVLMERQGEIVTTVSYV